MYKGQVHFLHTALLISHIIMKIVSIFFILLHKHYLHFFQFPYMIGLDSLLCIFIISLQLMELLWELLLP